MSNVSGFNQVYCGVGHILQPYSASNQEPGGVLAISALCHFVIPGSPVIMIDKRGDLLQRLKHPRVIHGIDAIVHPPPEEKTVRLPRRCPYRSLAELDSFLDDTLSDNEELQAKKARELGI